MTFLLIYGILLGLGIVWTGETDIIEGPCNDLEFLITELPGVSDFSFHPDWSLEVATVGCDDREDDCASGFYNPQDAFALTSDGSGMTFSVEAGTYGAPFSCNIDEACDTPATGGNVYAWRGSICRTEVNPESLADVRPGADFLECRGCNSGSDIFLGSAFDNWTPLAPMECVIFGDPPE